MEAYTSFAYVYDTFMDNVPYGEWARHIREKLCEHGVTDGIVLDLGCGTGTMTERLAELAREIADITIAAEDLREIVVLKRLSNAMMHRIQGNYRGIVGINAMLIALGVAGIIQPTTSALLHNTSTLAISLKSMGNLLPTN